MGGGPTPGWIRGSLDRARRARPVAVPMEMRSTSAARVDVDDGQGLTREAAGRVDTLHTLRRTVI